MPFNAAHFLFFFLPAALALYYLAPRPARHFVLLLVSLVFYAWGDCAGLVVLGFSILANYGLGLALDDKAGTPAGRRVLVVGLALNLALLFYYKYLLFFLHALGLKDFGAGLAAGAMPLGISFFTFQTLSYLMDLWRGKIRAERSLFRFALFLSFFAKMVAGPIARYTDMAADLKDRRANMGDFAEGARRFVVGLAKKTLIAGAMGAVADPLFSEAPANLDMASAWLGLVCYSLQIYFDFAGYTDMAVGLGRMFGFRLPENFDSPYVSQSVQEFWRRWHMTLSFWFRDYLYIPLGGNRVSKTRANINGMVVFLLCGLWHGAAWTFVVWGAWHGFFLTLERLGLKDLLSRAPRPLRHVYALLAIALGWVFFRAKDLPHALGYLHSLFSFKGGSFAYFSMTFVTRQFVCMLVIGLVASLSWRELRERYFPGPDLNQGAVWGALRLVLIASLLTLSAMQLAMNTYSPFIYARF